jgi:hypothetical protein
MRWLRRRWAGRRVRAHLPGDHSPVELVGAVADFDVAVTGGQVDPSDPLAVGFVVDVQPVLAVPAPLHNT